jgi:hypothetical protein
MSLHLVLSGTELIIWRTSCESGVKRLGEGHIPRQYDTLDAFLDQRVTPGTIVGAR